MHGLAQVMAGGGQEARLGLVGGRHAVAFTLQVADQAQVLEPQRHGGLQAAVGDGAEIHVHAQQAER
ncbi:hypothetical protein D3C72_2429780 [compost metagenome]